MTLRPSTAVYCGVKSFDLCFGEALWAELRHHGVDVLNLVLGQTDTPAHRQILEQLGLPYRWIEGSGILATAIARGVPPVATAVGTFPELCAEYDLGDPVSDRGETLRP